MLDQGRSPEPGPPPLARIPELRMGSFRTAWDTAPAAVAVVLGPEHVLVYQNATSRAMFGQFRLGTPLRAVPRRSAVDLTDFDRVLATGRPCTVQRRLVAVPGRDGGEVYLRYVLAPLWADDAPANDSPPDDAPPHDAPPDDGPSPGAATPRPIGVVVTAVDLSGEVRAELASQRARQLALVTDRVSRASTAHAALGALLDLVVPELADVAAVYVLPDPAGDAGVAGDAGDRPAVPGASGRRVAIAVSSALRHLGPTPGQHVQVPAAPWVTLLAAGRPMILPFPGHEHAEPVGIDPAIRDWLTAARARNVAIVPLVVAGALTGVLVLLATGDRPAYTEADLPFLTDVAARAGAAIAQVRARRQQVHVSQVLQRALLPAAPPALPGMQVAARYLAGAEGVEVGGDWWDVVPLDHAHVALGVGDVCGRGVDAAVVMGHARAAMRTAALAGLAPSRVLQLLDAQVRALVAERARAGDDDHPGPQFATALHAVLEMTTGRIRIANAGHLPLLVHYPGQGVTQLSPLPGAPLGLGLADYRDIEFDLPVGGSLLMFTDGLVEDRHRDLTTGLQQLAAALVDTAGGDVERSLDALVAAMLGPDGQHRPADDVAVVLLRRAVPAR